MYLYILQQWKNRKTTVLLIITGFFIGSLVMSLGISASIESFEYISDQKAGNLEHQLDVYLSRNGDWEQKDVENIIEKISEYGEIQLLSMGNRNLDKYEEKYQIVPVLFQQVPDWHIPLVEGRYFTVEDMNNQNSIIIGKSIAEKHNIQLGDSLVMEAKEFNVIGISGRSTRETPWEHVIYMPWKEYIGIYENCFLEMDDMQSVTIHLENGKEQFSKYSNNLIEEAKENDITLVYQNVGNVDTSSFRNALVITIMSTVLIFTIAIINIIHLMLYWLADRKREIGIMKALGANNGYIAKIVLFEVLVIAFIGCLLAILVQYMLMQLLSDTSIGREITFRVTWLNLFYAMGMSLFFGVISAIVPMRNVIRFDPISAINRT